MDTNEMSEEALRYLYSSRSAGQLFKKRDLDFLKNTLLRLGSHDGLESKQGGAGLMTI